MATKLIQLKCPDCGEHLEIEEGRRQCFCSYCGAKVLITNENEHIYRTIDEAKVKQTEVERDVRMREMELEEQKRKDENQQKWKTLKIMIILLFVGAVLIFIGTNHHRLRIFAGLGFIIGYFAILKLLDFLF